VTGQLYASAAVPPGKNRRYSLDRRLGGPQSRSGHSGGIFKYHSLQVMQWKKNMRLYKELSPAEQSFK